MNKQEFITRLREKLSGLPTQDVEERLAFYIEMIDDRMEEGLSEEKAVAAIGTIDEIAEQIVADLPLTKLVKEKIKPKRALRAWEIVLLVLGSPIWLSLLIAVFAVVLALYAVLWSLIVSVWAVFGALVGCTLGGLAAGIVLISLGKLWSGLALISVALLCAGLAIFTFFGCLAATKGMAVLTKKIAIGIKNCFRRKESVS